MSDPLLSVGGIAASYNGAIVALTAVTFAVAPGEILALLGSNGAGKSTILKAVSRLLKAERGALTAGRITFDGTDTAKLGPGDLVRRGLVPVLEGRRCFRSLTIEDNLVSGAIGRGSTRSETSADLERIYTYFPRLAEKRRLAAGLTSGGEQQMAAIGRALMGRPRLLVLDEPSMGLAPKVVEDIFAALRRLNASQGLTILVAEQNSAVALRHADRAVVIENGVSVLEGPAAEIAARGDIKAFYLGLSSAQQTATASA